ncbi:MAG: histidine kinase [Bacteroidales bacterium]|nr:histidine kinase [Bacteroidales bacterium]
MFEYLYKKRLAWILIVILLGCFFQFSIDVIFSLIYRNHPLLGSIRGYLFSIAISFMVMYGLSKLGKWMNKTLSWEKSPGGRFYLQVFAITFFVILMVMSIRTLFNLLFFPMGFIRLLDEMVIGVFFLFASLLLVFIDMGIHLLDKWRFSQAEIERFKKANLETQFEMLRTQVNPHFLFNSLNTLSSLIYENQDTASNYVREMSSVYRYILENRKADIVSLLEELSFTKSYVYMLSLRFENKIKFELNIDPRFNNKMVAPLTLQILIENAVKHNVVSQRKPLAIEIFTRNDNTLLVKNNLQPKANNSYSTGIGLDNIKNRLEMLTDRKMVVEKTENEFIVTIPLLDAKENKLIDW